MRRVTFGHAPKVNHPREKRRLGSQIRAKLVERANKWSELIGLGDRARFLFCNATISIKTLLANYPGDLSLVTVQFPDPHFKKKHRKRRTIQEPTVR